MIYDGYCNNLQNTNSLALLRVFSKYRHHLINRNAYLLKQLAKVILIANKNILMVCVLKVDVQVVDSQAESGIRGGAASARSLAEVTRRCIVCETRLHSGHTSSRPPLLSVALHLDQVRLPLEECDRILLPSSTCAARTLQ